MNVHAVTALLPARFGQVRSGEAIPVGLSGAEVHGVSTDAGDAAARRTRRGLGAVRPAYAGGQARFGAGMLKRAISG